MPDMSLWVKDRSIHMQLPHAGTVPLSFCMAPDATARQLTYGVLAAYLQSSWVRHFIHLVI